MTQNYQRYIENLSRPLIYIQIYGKLLKFGEDLKTATQNNDYLKRAEVIKKMTEFFSVLIEDANAIDMHHAEERTALQMFYLDCSHQLARFNISKDLSALDKLIASITTHQMFWQDLAQQEKAATMVENGGQGLSLNV